MIDFEKYPISTLPMPPVLPPRSNLILGPYDVSHNREPSNWFASGPGVFVKCHTASEALTIKAALNAAWLLGRASCKGSM